MIDHFDGIEIRCISCNQPLHSVNHDFTQDSSDHTFEAIRHQAYISWVTRWDVSCLCGWKSARGVDSKLTAELVAWLHLRRYTSSTALEFARNRGIMELVYN